MSTLTGPRSPTSPWPQESQTLPLTGSSSPNPLFPLCDRRPTPFGNKSPRGSVPELSGPNYFSINIESPNNSLKHRDNLSRVQSSIPSPKSHLIHKKRAPEDHVTASLGPSFGGDRDHVQTPAFKLSWNRALGGQGLLPGRPKTDSAHSAEVNGRPISADRCAELLETSLPELMLLDVRPYAHFSKGNIKGSLNLCIPTTLLKRPSFDTKKLANTFTNDTDRRNFARWKQCRYIIAYDASTANMKDAGALTNVLKKFTAEGWHGEGLVLIGGFSAFSNLFPHLTQQQNSAPGIPEKAPSPLPVGLPGATPIAGGCSLPESSHSVIPFFGNIRQHMDLVGGVGQIALHNSENITASKRELLPSWLREVSDPADKGRIIADRFLDLEKRELERMKQALTYDQASESSSNDPSCQKFRVAGIEKGAKNRYNNIYPYDHSRVRLQNIPPGGCDYVNANYLKAEHSNICYIATQAPVPDTFNDFWRMIWEQDVRLVVSLTAELERGQVKCHPYWKSGNYGPIRVENYSQSRIPIDSPDLPQTSFGSNKTSLDAADSTNPSIIVRHFGLSHSGYPFQPLREITQLQYPYWPDFGTTSQPRHLLKLIEHCDKIRKATNSVTSVKLNQQPAVQAQRPVLVHCSAGCGRTGTFCTVDSVLDILKRQVAQGMACHQDLSSVNTWSQTEHLDLIAKTVGDFRMQRPSMVQNLSQFVLCYESIIEWILTQITDGASLGQ